MSTPDLSSIQSQLSGLNSPISHPPRPPRPGQSPQGGTQPPGPPPLEGPTGDRIDISPEAASYDPAAADDPQFLERMERIREQIADGTYVTPDKLDVVADRLWTAINSPPPPEWYEIRTNAGGYPPPPTEPGAAFEAIE